MTRKGWQRPRRASCQGMRAKVSVSPCPWPMLFVEVPCCVVVQNCCETCLAVMSLTRFFGSSVILSEKDAFMVVELVVQLYGLAC